MGTGNGAVRWPAIIAILVGLLVTSVGATWTMLSEHGERPHKDAVSQTQLEQTMELVRVTLDMMRDDLGEIRKDIRNIQKGDK